MSNRNQSWSGSALTTNLDLSFLLGLTAGVLGMVIVAWCHGRQQRRMGKHFMLRILQKYEGEELEHKVKLWAEFSDIGSKPKGSRPEAIDLSIEEAKDQVAEKTTVPQSKVENPKPEPSKKPKNNQKKSLFIPEYEDAVPEVLSRGEAIQAEKLEAASNPDTSLTVEGTKSFHDIEKTSKAAGKKISSATPPSVSDSSFDLDRSSGHSTVKAAGPQLWEVVSKAKKKKTYRAGRQVKARREAITAAAEEASAEADRVARNARAEKEAVTVAAEEAARQKTERAARRVKTVTDRNEKMAKEEADLAERKLKEEKEDKAAAADREPEAEWDVDGDGLESEEEDDVDYAAKAVTDRNEKMAKEEADLAERKLKEEKEDEAAAVAAAADKEPEAEWDVDGDGLESEEEDVDYAALPGNDLISIRGWVTD